MSFRAARFQRSLDRENYNEARAQARQEEENNEVVPPPHVTPPGSPRLSRPALRVNAFIPPSWLVPPSIPSPPGSPRPSGPAPRITTRYPAMEAAAQHDWSALGPSSSSLPYLPSPPGSPLPSGPAPRITTRYPAMEASMLGPSASILPLLPASPPQEHDWSALGPSSSSSEEAETPSTNEAREVAQNLKDEDLWAFLCTRDGAQLLQDVDYRNQIQTKVNAFLSATAQGTYTSTVKAYFDAVEVGAAIKQMNAVP